MGIRINSIQSRDQVDIQNPQMAKTPLLKNDSPIPENLGAPLEKYADFIQKKEAAALKNAQNIRSAMVKNKFADFENQATIKVLEAQGENTFKAGDIAGQELKKNIAKELEKVPVQYRTEYANFAQDSIQRFNKTSQGRMISEGRKAGEEAFKRRSEDVTGRAVLNAYDKQAFEVDLQDLDSTVEQHTQLTMGSESPRAKELMGIHKKEARSTAIIKTIETLTASGDVAKATEIAQDYKDSLTANDLTKAYKFLDDGKKKRDLDTAKTVADDIYATYGDDEVAAFDAISKSTSDGQLARDIQTNYTARAAAQRRGDNEKRKQTFGDVQSQIIKTGQFTTEMRMSLDPRDAKAAQELYVRVSRGELIPRNNAVWNRMQRMFVDEPTKFSQQTFTDIQYQLPNTDINSLRRMQSTLLDPIADKFKPSGSSYILQKYLRQITAKPGTSRYIQEEAAIREMYTNNFLNAKANLGDRGSQEELDRAIDEGMAASTVKTRDSRNIIQRIWSDPKPVDMKPVPTPTEKGKKKFVANPAVPEYNQYYPEDVQKVRDYLKKQKKGIAPTDPELIGVLSSLRDKKQIRTK